MKCNVGKTDKIVRIVAGVVIVVLGIVFRSWWGVIGILPIVTATVGWCPAYLPFGISTCKIKGKSENM